MTKCNWKIYIVGHNGVHDWMYENDKDFNSNNYTVLDVGQERFNVSDRYSIIRQNEFSNYQSLGKWWAESEGIYNVWKNKIYENLDFVGFIHYDKELKLLRRKLFSLRTNITHRINEYLKDKTKAHISFKTHHPKLDYNQRIMADESQPNTLVGDGVNCYDYILNDYNDYFRTNYTIKDIFQKNTINLCSCFMIDVLTFEKMMKFWDHIVCSRKLEIFDTYHQHRLQGGLAERYFGVFLMFEYDKMLDLSIVHHYNKNIK